MALKKNRRLTNVHGAVRRRTGSPQAQSPSLYRISKFIESILDFRQLLQRIMEESETLVGAEASSILVYDEKAKEFFFEVALGEKGKEVKEVRLKLDQGIAGKAAMEKKTINIPDVRKSDLWDATADATSGFKTKSLMAVPMFWQGKLVGVIEVLNKNGGGAFTQEDSQTMAIIASQAALCIQNAKLFEENLRAARMAAIGQVIVELAHDVKNILQGFESGITMLDMGIEKNALPMIEKGSTILQKSKVKISNLVMNMLTYSREKKPSFRLCDVNEVVENVAFLMEARSKAADILLERDLGRNVKKLRIDPDGIYRVVLNLVSNAIDALEKTKGKITLRTRYNIKKKKLEIDVEDNGPGIPEAKVTHIFDLFYTSKGKGTGLGLAVCKKIVDAHGGEIKVDSKQGKGTTFKISLPID